MKLINKKDADEGEKGIVERFLEVNIDNPEVMLYIKERTNKVL